MNDENRPNIIGLSEFRDKFTPEPQGEVFPLYDVVLTNGDHYQIEGHLAANGVFIAFGKEEGKFTALFPMSLVESVVEDDSEDDEAN